jgi:glutamate 5-kinase
VITAHGTPARAYKQWIAGSLVPSGTLEIDEGALAALQRGKSLLPAGVRGVIGEFERGSCLRIRCADREVARGICAYNAAETRLIAGKPSTSIEAALGYCGPDELIHRDDLVMIGR